MKKIYPLFFVATLICAVSITSCKGNDNSENNAQAASSMIADTALNNNPTAAPPAAIQGADSLQSGVDDVLKDHPTVKGEISDSVINLTGAIKRKDWQKLIPTLNTLHPKRVNSSKLTIK